jgi:hypothetical protein
MPGMMDTILNLGLNAKSVVALAERSKSARFAYDSYRRLIQMFGSVVLEIPKSEFEEVFDAKKKQKKAKLDMDLDVEEEDFRWKTYLERDCVALYQAMEKYHDLVENKLGGEVGMTAPSTSNWLFSIRTGHSDSIASLQPAPSASGRPIPVTRAKATAATCGARLDKPGRSIIFVLLLAHCKFWSEVDR